MAPSPQTGHLIAPDGATLPYFTFGQGTRPMVYIPGAGDGIATAHEASKRLRSWLKGYDKHFKVLYISRREGLSTAHTHAHVACDVAWMMEQLQWGPSLIEGQSAGGAIAQHLAAQRPDLTALLVLSSTAAWLEPHAREIVSRWRELVVQKQWPAFFEQVAHSMWQDRRMSMLRPFERLLAQQAVPKHPERLLAILDNLLAMDQRDLLPRIQAPTLVSAGKLDALFGPTQQLDMAQQIPSTHLYFGEQYGHGHDIANPGHARRVAAFARMHSRTLWPMEPWQPSASVEAI